MRFRCGGNPCGSERPYLGRITNLKADAVGYDGSAISWEMDQAQEIDALVAVYCDGRLQALSASTDTAAVGNLGDGTHTLSARLVGMNGKAPSRLWQLGAQRVWLKWTASTVPDLAAYLIQEQDGSDWVTVQTISNRAVGELNQAIPAMGTGKGRISVYGTLVDTTLNGLVGMIVNASGELVLYNNEGTPFDSVEIAPFTTAICASGIRIYFHDLAEEYLENDAWGINVGIECNWQSEVLEPDTYVYRVLAEDNVGNLSAVVNSVTVRIQQLPEQAEEPSVSFDEVSGEYNVTISFANLPADGATVELYSNYNKALNTFEDAIYTKAPLAAFHGVVDEVQVLTLAPEGEFKFYLWTRLDGVLRDDLTLYSYNLPPTPEDQGIELGEILALDLTYNSSGVPSVAFTYDFLTGADATGFDILIQLNNNSPEWGSAQSIQTDEFITAQAGSYISYSFTDPGIEAETTDMLYCWVRTRTVEVVGNSATDSTEVDIDAPPAPVIELGMPS